MALLAAQQQLAAQGAAFAGSTRNWMSELLELSGRCAVVTGAASGVGAALAREAATEGTSLALCDVGAEALRSLAESRPSCRN